MDVEKFIHSGAPVQLSETITEGTSLCFVDSSFNPPNLAHSNLVQLCLEKFPRSVVVLQLATGNADKPTVSIEQLQSRANMMEILARTEFNGHGKVILGLTTAVKFAEKAKLANNAFPGSKIVFAMGFDTLWRIGDQRYYNEPVENVLRQFFAASGVLLLTRNGDSASQLPEGMVDAPQQPQVLQESPLFSPYLGKIHVFDAVPKTDQVSSSRARSSLSQLKRCVPAAVVEYIRRNRLYRDYDSE